jgi:hypothetical protein
MREIYKVAMILGPQMGCGKSIGSIDAVYIVAALIFVRLFISCDSADDYDKFVYAVNLCWKHTDRRPKIQCIQHRNQPIDLTADVVIATRFRVDETVWTTVPDHHFDVHIDDETGSLSIDDKISTENARAQHKTVVHRVAKHHMLVSATAPAVYDHTLADPKLLITNTHPEMVAAGHHTRLVVNPVFVSNDAQTRYYQLAVIVARHPTLRSIHVMGREIKDLESFTTYLVTVWTTYHTSTNSLKFVKRYGPAASRDTLLPYIDTLDFTLVVYLTISSDGRGTAILYLQATLSLEFLLALICELIVPFLSGRPIRAHHSKLEGILFVPVPAEYVGRSPNAHPGFASFLAVVAKTLGLDDVRDLCVVVDRPAPRVKKTTSISGSVLVTVADDDDDEDDDDVIASTTTAMVIESTRLVDNGPSPIEVVATGAIEVVRRRQRAALITKTERSRNRLARANSTAIARAGIDNKNAARKAKILAMVLAGDLLPGDPRTRASSSSIMTADEDDEKFVMPTHKSMLASPVFGSMYRHAIKQQGCKHRSELLETFGRVYGSNIDDDDDNHVLLPATTTSYSGKAIAARRIPKRMLTENIIVKCIMNGSRPFDVNADDDGASFRAWVTRGNKKKHNDVDNAPLVDYVLAHQTNPTSAPTRIGEWKKQYTKAKPIPLPVPKTVTNKLLLFEFEIARVVNLRVLNATKKMKVSLGTLGGNDTYTKKLATLLVVGLSSRFPTQSTNTSANHTIVQLFTSKSSKRLAVDVRRHFSSMDHDHEDEKKQQTNIDVVFSGIAQAHPSASCALTKCMCRATEFPAPSKLAVLEYDRVCLDIDVLLGLRDLRLQPNNTVVVPPSLVTKLKVAVKTNGAYNLFAHGLFTDDGGDDYGRALVTAGALSVPSTANTVLFRSSMAWKSLSCIVRADLSTLTTGKAVGTYLYNSLIK